MLKYFKRYKFLLTAFFILSVITLTLIYSLLKPERTLPIYQPSMVNADLVDTTIQYVRKYHKIADFKLVNQNGDTITQDYYKDKIYLVDFFFTTCQTICPIMTDNMVKVQEKIKNNPEVFLLSHTVIPAADSVPVLKKYAQENGVIDKKWNLVTGDKKQIYDLARKSYLASKSTGDGGKYDLIHTENLVLVDKNKQIRGLYDGTDPKSFKAVIEDIDILQKKHPRYFWEFWK